MWDKNPAAGGGEGAGKNNCWDYIYIYICFKSSSKSGKEIWHNIQSNPASGEWAISRRPLQACPWPDSRFSGGAAGLRSKVLPDNRRWEWTWNSSLTVQIMEKENKQLDALCVPLAEIILYLLVALVFYVFTKKKKNNVPLLIPIISSQ